MNREIFDRMRVWAALTGVVLAVCYFAMLYFGLKPTDTVPMLVAGIGGFELFLFAQDMVRRRQNG